MKKPSNPQEQADLAVLHAAMTEIKIRCYDSLIEALRTPAGHLLHTGYQSVPDRLSAAHLSKYPD